MVFLLMVLITFVHGMIAMENQALFLPESRVICIKHFQQEAVTILPYADCFNENDFSMQPEELKNKVKERIKDFILLKQIMENDVTSKEFRETYEKLKKEFTIHHHNLCVYALHNKAPNLLKELLQIPDIVNRKLIWKEELICKKEDKEQEASSKQKSGTIKDYIQLYMEQGDAIPEYQDCCKIIQEYRDGVQTTQ